MLDFLKRKLKTETKASRTGSVVSQLVANSVIYTPRNYETYAKEGYQSNLVVYRCINEIAGAIASLEWFCRTKEGQDIDSHPALDLIASPNNREGWHDFVRNMLMHYYISGNAYIEAKTSRADVDRITPPFELHCLRSDRMRIEAGMMGEPARFVYEAGQRVYFDANVRRFNDRWIGLINHLKEPHPTDDWYGLSPLEPIAFEIDRFNEAAKFNAALLQNSAMPSGVMVFEEITNPALLEQAKQGLYDEYSSPVNAGKPMVMAGKINWTQIGINPKDLHLNETLTQAAQDICNGLGVPPELILPIKSTHNNMTEARQMFWENTVIPMAEKLQTRFFNGWLSFFYPEQPQFYYDENQITALAPARAVIHDMAEKRWLNGLASFNETRIEMNMDTVTGGDDIYYGDRQAARQQQQTQLASDNRTLEKKNVLNLDTVADEIDQPAIRTNTEEQVRIMFEALAVRFGNDFLQEAGLTLEYVAQVAMQEWIATHTAEMVTQIDSTTKGIIREVIAQQIEQRATISQIKDALSARFSEFSQWRADMIATTETTQIMGESQLQAAKQAGIDSIEWLSVIDGATRDTHLGIDGAIVQTGTPFVLSDGDSGLRPGGFSRAGNNVRCRCAVAAAFEGEQRSYDERRMLWKQKDATRLQAEQEFANLYLQVFDVQLQSVLKRIDDVTQ